MLLCYSLGLGAEAVAVEQAVEKALAEGARTQDIAANGNSAISTTEMTATILGAI